jgi:P-type Cu2+ transporter
MTRPLTAPQHAPDREPACAHCGLPAQRDPGADASEPAFCCSGCRAVYRVLHEAGLGEYYNLQKLGSERAAEPASPRQASYAEFDEPSFLAAHTRPAGSLRSIELLLEGVHCAACVWLVERLPQVLPGVASCRLDLGRGSAELLFDPSLVQLSRIARTLDSFGYPPHPYRSVDRVRIRKTEDRSALIRLGIAGAVAGNTMLLAVALYAGAAGPLASLFRWASLMLTVVSLAWPGRTFFATAIAGLRTRKLHMDLPISLALIGAGGFSAAGVLAGSNHIYFDSITMLVFLLLAARYVQSRALRAASDASELLLALTPSTARRVHEDGSVREVPSDALVTGDVFEVLAGDSVPADGTVLRGASRLDNALLTGESMPVDAGEGSEIHAGATNMSARLVVRATATGDATRVGKLLKAVQEAQARRAPIVQSADRMASWFVAAVLGLAALAAVVWAGQGPATALERAIAMLVVTCPCALGLATPLALSHAIGAAARNGIFIKGSDTVEALARVNRLILDKTGTLTTGRVALVGFEGPAVSAQRLAALEAHSAHPFARAMGEPRAWSRDREGAGPGFLPPAAMRVDSVYESSGGGIQGCVEGVRVIAGTAAYLASHGCALTEDWSHRAAEAAEAGQSPVLVAEDGHVVALAVFGDTLRADTLRAVESLRAMKLSLGILSGDHPGAVRHVAGQLGIAAGEARGGVEPEGKLRIVEALQQTGLEVAMVGDGVNDAGALAAARVGIAVRGGAEVSLATADAFLTRPGLLPAVDLVKGCRSTLRVIHRNLAISIVYNVIGATLAMAGLIGPLAAAILMPVSSLTVILSSVWARPFPSVEPKGEPDGLPLAPAAQEVSS